MCPGVVYNIILVNVNNWTKQRHFSKTTLPVVILHTAQPIVQAFEQMPHPSLSSSELHNEEVLKGEPDDIYYWS